jgi:hypothetical protein
MIDADNSFVSYFGNVYADVGTATSSVLGSQGTGAVVDPQALAAIQDYFNQVMADYNSSNNSADTPANAGTSTGANEPVVGVTVPSASDPGASSSDDFMNQVYASAANFEPVEGKDVESSIEPATHAETFVENSTESSAENNETEQAE